MSDKPKKKYLTHIQFAQLLDAMRGIASSLDGKLSYGEMTLEVNEKGGLPFDVATTSVTEAAKHLGIVSRIATKGEGRKANSALLAELEEQILALQIGNEELEKRLAKLENELG